MKQLLGVWLLCTPLLVHAQFTYVRNHSVSVFNADGTQLANPWTAGLNAIQYSTIDLNADGVTDLLLFDRMANKPITFITVDGQYVYSPEYEDYLPELYNWVLAIDYNCDGKKDIYTGNALGMCVYTNVTPDGGTLTWEKFLFATDGSTRSEILLTEGSSGKTNLQLQYDDLPAIVDVDNDGDVDILSMSYGGSYAIEFHKNMAMENYGSCDSLEYVRVTRTWGEVQDCVCGTFAFNGADCPDNTGRTTVPASTERTEHAGGKALLAFDFDGDNDMDILFSEATCNYLYLLENEGDSETPVFNTAAQYPTTDPVDFVIFPAAYYEDVDFDGVKDFMVSPNLYSREYIATDFESSNWFYKNVGTTAQPDLGLMQKDFLQDQMIDVGDNATPAFADMDDDGDLDLFIGQYIGEDGDYGSIRLYENIGSETAPSFQFVTDDYASIRALELYNIKPQFYDVNSDSKTDLIIGGTLNPESSSAEAIKLYTILNKSSSGLNFSGQTATDIDFSISHRENYLITDVNLDGLPDALVGKSDGTIEYWENAGPEGSLNLSLENDDFLSLGLSVDLQTLALSTGDLDADGEADLVMGDVYGELLIVSDYRSAADDTEAPTMISDILYSELSETYYTPNLGGRVWPTVANLFNTSRPAIVVGTLLGGLHILENDGSTALPETPTIKIYPNPVSKSGTLNIWIDRAASIQVFSAVGQQLTEAISLDASQTYPLETSTFAAGLYLIRFTVSGAAYTKRIIIY